MSYGALLAGLEVDQQALVGVRAAVRRDVAVRRPGDVADDLDAAADQAAPVTSRAPRRASSSCPPVQAHRADAGVADVVVPALAAEAAGLRWVNGPVAEATSSQCSGPQGRVVRGVHQVGAVQRRPAGAQARREQHGRESLKPTSQVGSAAPARTSPPGRAGRSRSRHPGMPTTGFVINGTGSLAACCAFMEMNVAQVVAIDLHARAGALFAAPVALHPRRQGGDRQSPTERSRGAQAQPVRESRTEEPAEPMPYLGEGGGDSGDIRSAGRVRVAVWDSCPQRRRSSTFACSRARHSAPVLPRGLPGHPACSGALGDLHRRTCSRRLRSARRRRSSSRSRRRRPCCIHHRRGAGAKPADPSAGCTTAWTNGLMAPSGRRRPAIGCRAWTNARTGPPLEVLVRAAHRREHVQSSRRTGLDPRAGRSHSTRSMSKMRVRGPHAAVRRLWPRGREDQQSAHYWPQPASALRRRRPTPIWATWSTSATWGDASSSRSYNIRWPGRAAQPAAQAGLGQHGRGLDDGTTSPALRYATGRSRRCATGSAALRPDQPPALFFDQAERPLVTPRSGPGQGVSTSDVSAPTVAAPAPRSAGWPIPRSRPARARR